MGIGRQDKPVRIEVILPDNDTETPHMTDASVLRLARLIGRQMAREDHERQKRSRRRRQSVPGQKS
ncbi:hypothetical protein [Nguyenibacter sp. L1]|uniref:hypothetical protein n=1 Tax=Nguyenibacter sp. L1 TaxID=3049350 RepID=UPI002B4997EF|nr:hypothetical protein [Nguyenibacter sp. L1]WRH86343.1 hypothetical protein QN315_09735 [Nguyenibacter sp. L1]